MGETQINRPGTVTREGAASGGVVRRVLVLLGVLLAGLVSQASGEPQSAQCPGSLSISIPNQVHNSQHFTVTYLPRSSGATASATVYFGNPVFYDIRDAADHGLNGATPVSLPPNVPEDFKISVDGDNPGVLQLSVSINGDPTCTASELLDSGFQDLVEVDSQTKKFSVTTAPPDGKSGSDDPDAFLGKQLVALNFVRRSDRTVITFGFSPELEVVPAGNDARLFSEDGSQSLPSNPRFNVASGAVFQVENYRWGKSEEILVKVLGNQNSPIATYYVSYRTGYPGTLLFIAALVGALLYLGVDSIPALNRPMGGGAAPAFWVTLRKEWIFKLLMAVVVVLLVFLLKGTNVLDTIKVDPTTISGSLLLGFCANALGLEAIVRKIKKLIDP